MARPRTVSDEQILQATMKVVAREGARRFTLAQVGEEAGLTAAGVLKRFGTRRALLLALSERSRRDPGDALRTARAARASPLAALIEGLAGVMHPLTTPREVATSLEYLALDMADREFNEHARAFFSALRSEVAALLDEARRAGELLEETDTAGLAGIVVVAFNGSVVTWAVSPTGALRDAIRRDLSAVLAPFRPTRRDREEPSPRASRRRGAGRACRGT